MQSVRSRILVWGLSGKESVVDLLRETTVLFHSVPSPRSFVFQIISSSTILQCLLLTNRPDLLLDWSDTGPSPEVVVPETRLLSTPSLFTGPHKLVRPFRYSLPKISRQSIKPTSIIIFVSFNSFVFYCGKVI